MQTLINHYKSDDFDNSNFIHSFAPSKANPLIISQLFNHLKFIRYE